MNNTIILLISLILLAGCASTPPPKTATGADSKEQTSDLKKKNSHMLAEDSLLHGYAFDVDVWMKASMKIAFPELNHSISATIEMAKMDSVLLTISAMFGISVGKMFATPDEFIMNNNLDNTTYIGQPTRENMLKAAFIDLSYSDLLCALKCIPPQPLDKYSFNLATGAYTYQEDTFLESIYFDDGRISKLVRADKLGNEMITINYSKHNKVGKYWFATAIWITFPQANGSINIALTDIQINRKLTSPMRLNIPKSYNIIDF